MDGKARFGDLVRNAGRPKVTTLWTKPEKDRALSRAIHQNRVLTVIQEPGKKDHGIIGFRTLPGAVFLVFPRPLPQRLDARIIGINYQLVEEPLTLHAMPASGEKKAGIAAETNAVKSDRRVKASNNSAAHARVVDRSRLKVGAPAAARSEVRHSREPNHLSQEGRDKHHEHRRPTRQGVHVTVRRIAIYEDDVEVECGTKRAAEQLAREAIERKPFNLPEAEVRTTILKISPVREPTTKDR